jgi:restriction-modification enzyme MmeI-like protein
LPIAQKIAAVCERIQKVRSFREASPAKTTKGYAAIPHKFAQRAHKNTIAIAVAAASSEEREYLPADIFDQNTVISNLAFAVYDPSLWEFAVVCSKMHIAWVATVCDRGSMRPVALAAMNRHPRHASCGERAERAHRI